MLNSNSSGSAYPSCYAIRYSATFGTVTGLGCGIQRGTYNLYQFAFTQTSTSSETSSSTTISFTTPVRPTAPSIYTPAPQRKNTGAIAGGVVGGVAVIGLLVGGFVWWRIQHKRKAREEVVREMAETN